MTSIKNTAGADSLRIRPGCVPLLISSSTSPYTSGQAVTAPQTRKEIINNPYCFPIRPFVLRPEEWADNNVLLSYKQTVRTDR